MIYHPPILPYCGLQILVSKPSRIDQYQLLSGYPGQYLEKCLSPFSRHNCDIRLVGETSPQLPGTKVILRLGDFAKSLILGDNHSLNESRGNVYPRNDLVNIVTYELQDCFDRKNYDQDSDSEDDEDLDEGSNKDHSKTRRKNFRYWFYNDCQKAVKILKEGYQPRVLLDKFQIYPQIEDVIYQLESAKDQQIFIDIETNENFRITCLSLAIESGPVVCVPVLLYTGNLAYSDVKMARFFMALSIGFHNNIVIGHNLLFDLFILVWIYKVIPPPLNQIRDTMIMQHRVSPETEKSLGHCISLYLQEPFHKDEGVFSPKSSEQDRQLWTYNSKDVSTTRLIYQEITRLYPDLQESFDRGNRLVYPYLLMSLQGINIDQNFQRAFLEEQESLKTQYLRIIKLLTGYEWDCISPQKISKYLYDYLGIQKPKPVYVNNEIKYEELTSAGTLYNLAIKRPIPFLKVLFRYRHATKKAGFLKFTPWMGITPDLKFTSTSKITGTDTYRIASSKLFGRKGKFPGTIKFNGWGSNAQNIERELRKVLVPSKGKILVKSDQSGAEALVVAYLAPKGRYRQLFENKVKVHSYVALHLFKNVWEKELGGSVDHLISMDIPKLKRDLDWIKLEKIIKSSDNWEPSRSYYYIAKMVCHASNYGMKGPTFTLNVLKKSEGQVILSIGEANFFLDLYHTLFPEIRIWHYMVIKQLEDNRTLYNLFGDRRIFNEPHFDDQLFKKAYAFVPQSTVGMITNVAISEIQEQICLGNLDYCDMDLLSNEHDALMTQCPIGNQLQVARLQEKHLAKTFFKGEENEFTMRSESHVGFNAFEMEDI